jgi:cell division topological specificity factor
MGLMELFRKKNSGDVAKDRLKLLLVSDRANCSSEMMEQIKNEIIQVISKYMDIDTEGLDIQITQTESDGSNGTVPALFANIPIKDIHHNSGSTNTNTSKNKR